MANEIPANYDSGENLYFVVFNAAGQANTQGGNTFENWETVGNYDHAITEVGLGGCKYVGDFPATITSAGVYTVVVFLREGAAPADGDPRIAEGEVVWNGTAEELVIDSNGRVDVGTVLGVTPSAGLPPLA